MQKLHEATRGRRNNFTSIFTVLNFQSHILAPTVLLLTGCCYHSQTKRRICPRDPIQHHHCQSSVCCCRRERNVIQFMTHFRALRASSLWSWAEDARKKFFCFRLTLTHITACYQSFSSLCMAYLAMVLTLEKALAVVAVDVGFSFHFFLSAFFSLVKILQ